MPRRLELVYDNQVKGLQDLKALKQIAEDIRKAIGEYKDAADQAGGSVQAMGGHTAKTALDFAAMSAAIYEGARALKAITIDAATYAARTETLSVVTDRLAKVNNLSRDAVRSQVLAVRDQGITTQEAYQTVNKMIFAQLDLAKSTQLARLAQDAAVIAGVNSSEALNGIVHGIVTRQPEVLRTYGIIVNFEEDFSKAARSLGRDLTAGEKTQVAMNKVLAEGAKITGTYEASMTTAGKQLTSLQRYWDEAKNSLGQGLIPALGNTVSLMKEMSQYAQENQTQFTRLATGATALAVGMAAFKLTPGHPLLKLGVGAIAAGGTYLAGNPDPVKYYQENVKSAMDAISRRETQLTAKTSKRELDGDSYKNQFKALEDQRAEIKQGIAEALAGIFMEKGKGIMFEAERLAQNMTPGAISPGDVLLAIQQKKKAPTAEAGPLFNQELYDKENARALAEQMAKEAQAAQEHVTSILKRLNTEGLDPLSKLMQEMLDDIKDLQTHKGRHASAGQIAAVQAAYNTRIWETEQVTLAPQKRQAIGDVPIGYNLMPSSIDLAERWRQEQMRQRRALTGFPVEQLQPDTAFSDQAVSTAKNRALTSMQRYVSFQERVVQLTTGPGGEIAAIEQVAALREQLAKREYDLMHDKFKYQEDMDQIQKDRILQRLELQKKERDEYLQGAGQLFDSMRQKGAVGIGDFFVGQLETSVRKMFVNTSGLFYDTLKKNSIFQIPGQVGADGKLNTLGKIVQGTPFGIPPTQIAQDRNTSAVSRLTVAVDRNTVALGGIPTSGLAGAVPGISSGTAATGLLDQLGLPVSSLPSFSIPALSVGGGSTSSLKANLAGFFSGATSVLSGANPFNTIMGRDSSIQTAPGRATTAFGGPPSTAQRVGAAAAIGGAALGAYEGISAGIHTGGARGTAQAISAGLGAAAIIPGPQQPFIAAAAVAAGVLAHIFPDSKQVRTEFINSLLESRKFTEAVSMTRDMDIYGNLTDHDFQGNARSYKGSTTVNQYNVTIPVDAIDSKGFIDHADDVGSALQVALQRSHGVRDEIQQVVNPR